MSQHLAYSRLCPSGSDLDSQRAKAKTVLARTALRLQDDEDNPQLATQVASQRDTYRQIGVALSRHVGHCPDCERAPQQHAELMSNRRAPTHDKPELPPMRDLARRLRDGEALEAIAAEYDRSPATLRPRLAAAGFSSTDGKPIDGPRRAVPAAADTRTIRHGWKADANCASTDPEEFFPEKGGTTRRAKAVCGRCTVAAECLDNALENNERFGIFGGLSPRERRPLLALLHPNLDTTQEAS